MSPGEVAKLQRAEHLGIHRVGRRDGAAHNLDPMQGIAAAGENGALIEPCPVLEVGEAMFDAMGHHFISASCRPLWITPNNARSTSACKACGARYRVPKSSCTGHSLRCGSGGLLRVAKGPEHSGKIR